MIGKVIIPPGHRVTNYRPTYEPEFYTTNGGTMIADLGVASDEFQKAISLGGDGDTMTCVAGGIAEAFYGEVPDRHPKPLFFNI
jgi:hypothetical protein